MEIKTYTLSEELYDKVIDFIDDSTKYVEEGWWDDVYDEKKRLLIELEMELENTRNR